MEQSLPKNRAATRVTIGLDGKINTRDVAEILGCSISTVALIRKKGKIRAQSIEGEYWYEASEIYRARDTALVRPHKRKNAKSPTALAEPSKEQKHEECARLEFKYPKERFEFIKLALGAANKTPVEYVTEKLDALYEQIKAKLSTIDT